MLKFQKAIIITRALLLCLLACTFKSCTKPLDIPLDDENQNELVLSCFFTSDVQEVHLTKLRPILQSDVVPEEAATVELLHQNIPKATLSHQGNGIYKSSGTNLIAGAQYDIKVITAQQTIHATDILPQTKVAVDSATYFFVTSADGNTYLDFSLHFNDPEGETNYYEFIILHPYYDEQKDSTLLAYYNDIAIPDAVLDREGDLTYRPSSFLFRDDLIDGTDYKMQLRFEHSAVGGRDWIPGKYRNNESEYFLIMRSISEHYYLFRKSWFRHRYNQSTDNQFNNELQLLFGSEPFTLFSNTSNGLGIFAGYHEVIVPIQEL